MAEAPRGVSGSWGGSRPDASSLTARNGRRSPSVALLVTLCPSVPCRAGSEHFAVASEWQSRARARPTTPSVLTALPSAPHLLSPPGLCGASPRAKRAGMWRRPSRCSSTRGESPPRSWRPGRVVLAGVTLSAVRASGSRGRPCLWVSRGSRLARWRGALAVSCVSSMKAAGGVEESPRGLGSVRY